MQMHNDYAKDWPLATRFLQGIEARLKKTDKKVLQAFLDACMADIQRDKKPHEVKAIALAALRSKPATCSSRLPTAP